MVFTGRYFLHRLLSRSLCPQSDDHILLCMFSYEIALRLYIVATYYRKTWSSPTTSSQRVFYFASAATPIHSTGVTPHVFVFLGVLPQNLDSSDVLPQTNDLLSVWPNQTIFASGQSRINPCIQILWCLDNINILGVFQPLPTRNQQASFLDAMSKQYGTIIASARVLLTQISFYFLHQSYLPTANNQYEDISQPKEEDPWHKTS